MALSACGLVAESALSRVIIDAGILLLVAVSLARFGNPTDNRISSFQETAEGLHLKLKARCLRLGS